CGCGAWADFLFVTLRDPLFFFFSSRRRHTRCYRDWSSDVCSSDLIPQMAVERLRLPPDSPLVGKTLAATGLRTQTGALVLAVARGTDEIATPGPRSEEHTSELQSR